jgi:hypothetical protein
MRRDLMRRLCWCARRRHRDDRAVTACEPRRGRKRTGIEPAMPLLAQSIIGFEDRGRHQSGTRFHGRT